MSWLNFVFYEAGKIDAGLVKIGNDMPNADRVSRHIARFISKNPRLHVEETQYHRQAHEGTNKLYLPLQDDCWTRKDTKLTLNNTGPKK